MLFEFITTSTMLGVIGASYYFKTNHSDDGEKILKIAENCGLRTKEEKIRLYRRNRNKEQHFTEYVFKIPLGLELEDFQNKHGKFKDGLNNRSERKIILKDLQKLKIDRSLPKQIESLLYNRISLSKEIEMEYDGMLKIRVYDRGLESRYDLTEDMITGRKKWHVPLGKGLNKEMVHDFEKAPHVLIGGATDMGKSNILNLITCVLLKNHPEDVKFTLVDLKGGLEFGPYENIKQVEAFASNAEEAKIALESIQSKMSKTFEFLRMNGFKDVKRAGIKERHFVIIDEAAELSSDGETDKEVKTLKIECENIIKDIARRGRASGIRLLYCTQYPTTETVSSQV